MAITRYLARKQRASRSADSSRAGRRPAVNRSATRFELSRHVEIAGTWLQAGRELVTDQLRTGSPSPKRGEAPQFSDHICCGQMAGWIKMSLAREVGLSPSDIVLDGYPAPHPPKRDRAPNFRPMFMWPNGWMMPLGTEVGLGPVTLCYMATQLLPPAKRCTARSFWPMSVVAKWLDGSRCHLVGR